jgi:Phosphoesterase family
VRTTIAPIPILIAICLGIFAAAPGNSHTAALSTGAKNREAFRSNGGPSIVGDARSPIRHLIVVVGENRSFDNVFGTYVPSNPTQTVWNLLSQDIVQINGNIGTNFEAAAQQEATDTMTYELSPTQTGHFQYLPQPSTTLSALPTGPCNLKPGIFCSDIGLDPTSQGLLSTRGTGQSAYDPTIGATPVPDCRYPSDLDNGPYLLLGDSELNNCGTPFPPRG